jgi:hypothetical protein
LFDQNTAKWWNYKYSRFNIVILDPINSSIELHLFSRKSSWSYDSLGTGTCGAMLDLNDATTDGNESVIVACTYTKFKGSSDWHRGGLRNEAMPTLLKIDLAIWHLRM